MEQEAVKKQTKFLYKGTIHYPKSPHITALRCEGLKVKEIPSFPPNLEILELCRTPVRVLPEFPHSLKKLRIESTLIRNFPSFPLGLEELVICNAFELQDLPEFPPNLTRLIIGGNRFNKKLPSLPLNLEVLKLKEIGNPHQIQPDIRNLQKLKKLEWTNSYMSSTYQVFLPENIKTVILKGPFQLSNLPTKIVYLDIRATKTTELTQLPPKLRYLDCGSNLLREIPCLPRTLKYLNCTNTPITQLPPLPEGFRELHSHLTSVIYLPELPKSIKVLNFQTQSIMILPDTLREYLINSHHSEYNRFVATIKMFQATYKAKVLRKEKRKKAGEYIANWIYEQGMKPSGFFAKKAIAHAQKLSELRK